MRSSIRYVIALAALAVVAGGVFAAFRQGNASGRPAPTASATGAVSGTPAASSGAIAIYNPLARVSLNDSSVLYFTIRNSGPADSLQSVNCDASPAATLHDSVVEGASGSMKLLQEIPVPANGQVALQTGGLHVMLEQLPRPLVVGDQVRCTLSFRRAGQVGLTAPVRDYGN